MFKQCKNFIIIFIYFAALQLKPVQNEKIVKLLEITCKSMLPQAFNYTECKMEHVSRDVYEVTILGALYQRPLNNLTLIYSVVMSGYENRQPMLQHTVDWCAFFHSKRRNFLAKFAYSIMGLKRYSNMNHSCPYDHDLLVDHYPFDGKAVGKVQPFGNGIFTFITKWYANNIFSAEIKIRFQAFER